jgi:hypothetical protein
MMEADQNGDGKLDFDEFKTMVQNTDIAKQMTLEGESPFQIRRSSALPSSWLSLLNHNSC